MMKILKGAALALVFFVLLVHFHVSFHIKKYAERLVRYQITEQAEKKIDTFVDENLQCMTINDNLLLLIKLLQSTLTYHFIFIFMALNITFRQLKVFASAAKHLSYTRAAEELHLSQPGVSMQIKQLEEVIGLKLFEQIGKKMHLTDVGKEIFAYSKSIGYLLDEAEVVLNELKGLQTGRLFISVATTASHFATRLLAAFSQQHKTITISLDITNRASLKEQLEANKPDLVIMGQPPEGVDVVAEVFMDNPLVMIAPMGHYLSKQPAIKLADIENESFVVREPGSGTRSAIERFFSRHQIKFNTGIEMTSNEAIKQAVEAGLGLGIVSIHTLELELETQRLQILDVAEFPILRHWYILQRKGKRLSPIAQAFKQFVLTQAKDFIRLS